MMTRYLFRPCGMCNWMSDDGPRFHWGYCMCPDSDIYNEPVDTENGTCEYWTAWICDNPAGPTPEQIVEWFGGE